MNKKKIIIGSVVFVILAIAAYSFIKPNTDVLIEAKTVTVKKGNVTTMVTATGTIEPITQVEVGTQVSGVVEKIYVDYNRRTTHCRVRQNKPKSGTHSSASGLYECCKSEELLKNYL